MFPNKMYGVEEVSPVNGAISGVINGPVNGPVNGPLNDIGLLVYGSIKTNPKITKNELSIEVKKGRTTITRTIKSLKDNNYIDRVGSDKTGYWKILK